MRHRNRILRLCGIPTGFSVSMGGENFRGDVTNGGISGPPYSTHFGGRLPSGMHSRRQFSSRASVAPPYGEILHQRVAGVRGRVRHIMAVTACFVK